MRLVFASILFRFMTICSLFTNILICLQQLYRESLMNIWNLMPKKVPQNLFVGFKFVCMLFVGKVPKVKKMVVVFFSTNWTQMYAGAEYTNTTPSTSVYFFPLILLTGVIQYRNSVCLLLLNLLVSKPRSKISLCLVFKGVQLLHPPDCSNSWLVWFQTWLMCSRLLYCARRLAWGQLHCGCPSLHWHQQSLSRHMNWPSPLHPM